MFTYLFNPDKGESFILSCLRQIWACLEKGFLIPISVPFLRESHILNFSRKEWGGGGNTPLYKPYRYVPPQREVVFVPFRSEKGIDFADIGLESGMVFEEATKVYERTYRFNAKWIRKKE